MGRLSMIRKLTFTITADPRFVSLGTTNRPTREEICRDWVDFLVAHPGHYKYVHLPELHTLGLDFSEWRFKPDEAFFVSR